jgi:hypothetical protein
MRDNLTTNPLYGNKEEILFKVQNFKEWFLEMIKNNILVVSQLNQ